MPLTPQQIADGWQPLDGAGGLTPQQLADGWQPLDQSAPPSPSPGYTPSDLTPDQPTLSGDPAAFYYLTGIGNAPPPSNATAASAGAGTTAPPRSPLQQFGDAMTSGLQQLGSAVDTALSPDFLSTLPQRAESAYNAVVSALPHVGATATAQAAADLTRTAGFLEIISPSGIGANVAARLSGVPSPSDALQAQAEKLEPKVARDDVAGGVGQTLGSAGVPAAEVLAAGPATTADTALARAGAGVTAMAVPAMQAAQRTYTESRAKGASPLQAFERSAVAGVGTLAMGAVPVVGKSVGEQAVAGATSNVAIGRAMNDAMNAVSPPQLQSPH